MPRPAHFRRHYGSAFRHPRLRRSNAPAADARLSARWSSLNGHSQAISYPSLDHSVLDGLRALSGSNASDLIGVLATAFTCDLPMRIAQLEMAVAAGDVSALKARAAGLRGLAAGLGLARMAALCASLAVRAEHDELGLAAGALAAIREEGASVLPLLEREAGLNPTEGEAAA
jgi:HPt (histidine-containing phosphotransfer) domain-containing protein